MASKLGEIEVNLIAYLLGLNSNDIVTLKLICKKWNTYLIKITKKTLKKNIDDDEKEEEKSFKPKYNNNNNDTFKRNNINIQRSQPVMVSGGINNKNYQYRKTKPNNMISTNSINNTIDDNKVRLTSPQFIGSKSPSHRHRRHKRHHRRKVHPSDFLKHSLDRAFWRLDQNTVDKIIASGKSPHVHSNDIKITQNYSGLLTEKEQKYIEKKSKNQLKNNNNNNTQILRRVHKSSSYAQIINDNTINNYIPTDKQLLHTPNIDPSPSNTITPILAPKSMKNTLISPHRKNANDDNNNIPNIPHSKVVKIANAVKISNQLGAAGIMNWSPKYPLYLLKNDKSYQKQNEYQQLKKQKKFKKTKSRNYGLSINEESITYDDDDDDDPNYKSLQNLKHPNRDMNKPVKVSKSLSKKLKKQKLKKQNKSDKNKKHKKQNSSSEKHLTTMFDPDHFDDLNFDPMSPQLQSKKSIHNIQTKPKKMGFKSKFSKFLLNQSMPTTSSRSMNKRNINNMNKVISINNTKYNKQQIHVVNQSPNGSNIGWRSDGDNDDNDDIEMLSDDDRNNNQNMRNIINESNVKNISYLHAASKSKGLFGNKSDENDVDIDDVVIEQNKNDIKMDINEYNDNNQDIDNANVFGSNLSKSLLLNQSNNGYPSRTIKDRRYSDEYKPKIVITPYELRKQHSLLITPTIDDHLMDNKDKSPSLSNINPNYEQKANFIHKLSLSQPSGPGNSLEMSTSWKADFVGSNRRVSYSTSTMGKLMAPLYTEEEKIDWKNIKKVDNKYESVLKKRKRRSMQQLLSIDVSTTGTSSNTHSVKSGQSGNSRHSGHSVLSSPIVTYTKRNSNSNTTSHTTTNTINTTPTSQRTDAKTTKSNPSFLTGIYQWFMGNKSSNNDKNNDHNDNKKTVRINKINDYYDQDYNNSLMSESATMTMNTDTSLRYDDIGSMQSMDDMSSPSLLSPLLIDQDRNIDVRNKELFREEQIQQIKTQYQTTQISFWKDVVLNNWNLLHKTSVVRLFWEREGIPKSCRGSVWANAIGNKLKIAATAYDSVYKVTNKQINDYITHIENEGNTFNNSNNNIKSLSIFSSNNTQQIVNDNNDRFCEGLKRKNSIERDISRLYGFSNFNNISLNNLSLKHMDILSVLMAFCNCRKQISYIQFETHLTQILLHYQSPSVAFISLANMLNTELFEIYIHCNVLEIRQRIEIFTKMLVYNSSDIARHLQKLSILADTYVMDWCNGLFSSQLPLNIVSRVWDLYFLNGEIIIWKTAVALLIVINEKLKIIKKSHHNIVKILQSIKKYLLFNDNIKGEKRGITEQYFVKKIYSIKLPRDVRKWFKKKEIQQKKKNKKRLQRQKQKRNKKRKQKAKLKQLQQQQTK